MFEGREKARLSHLKDTWAEEAKLAEHAEVFLCNLIPGTQERRRFQIRTPSTGSFRSEHQARRFQVRTPSTGALTILPQRSRTDQIARAYFESPEGHKTNRQFMNAAFQRNQMRRALLHHQLASSGASQRETAYYFLLVCHEHVQIVQELRMLFSHGRINKTPRLERKLIVDGCSKFCWHQLLAAISLC